MMNLIEQEWCHFSDFIKYSNNEAKVRKQLKARQLLKWKKVSAGMDTAALHDVITRVGAIGSNWIADFYKIISIQETSLSNLAPTAKPFLTPFVSYAKQQLEEQVDKAYHLHFNQLIQKLETILGDYIKQASHAYAQANQETESAPDQYILSFFEAYPVLARICTTRTLNWIVGTKLFFDRLTADNTDFKSITGAATNDVQDVFPLNSDIHSFAGEVLKVCFTNGKSIIYKPKSPAAELFLLKFQNHLQHLEGRLFFYLPKLLPREAHFWQETIAMDPVEAIEKETLLPSVGRFMAMCNLLLMEDYHIENLIINNSKLVSIDNELLFPPYSEAHANYRVTKDSIINNSFYYSLLNQSIIPDLYSLFYNDFEDRYGLYAVDLDFSQEDAALLVAGFTDFVTAFKRHESEIVAFLLKEIKEVPTTRHLVRTTAHYYHLIDFLSARENLVSHTSFLLSSIQHLKRPVVKDILPLQMRILADEASFIFHFDIPLFFYQLNEASETDGGEYSLDRFYKQLQNWKQKEYLQSQINILTSCSYLKNKKGFYLTDIPSPDTDLDYEKVAVKLAKNIAYLYGNLYNYQAAAKIDERYLTFAEGITGVLPFLAIAFNITNDLAIKEALERIIACFLVHYNHTITQATEEEQKELMHDWLNTIGFTEKFYRSPAFTLMQDSVKSKCNALNMTARRENAACLPLSDPFIAESALLQSAFMADNDTCADGNFHVIIQLLYHGIKNNRPEQIGEAKKRCNYVLQQRQKSGFALKSKIINPYVKEGLSGIGLALFLLADISLFSEYETYLLGSAEQVKLKSDHPQFQA